ncbi:MAG: glycoside hydrolase family 19 protein [Mycobacterium sp.]
MEPLTFDDVRLRWDPAAVHQVFQIATRRADTMHKLGENLQLIQKTALERWGGQAGQAFQDNIGSVRQGIEADGQESKRVAAAVARGEGDVARLQSEARRLNEWATANHWTITPDWKVDIGNTGVGRGRDLQFVTAWQSLQADLGKLQVQANEVDEELAAAVRTSVGDATADPQGSPTPTPIPADGYTPVSTEQLREIVPEMSQARAEETVGPLNQAMREGGMNTPVRQAAFISQVAVESDRFNTFEEYADGSDYEGRADLGNTQPGDGTRYKGRGAIQVTGRHNYTQMSEDLGVDFVNHPELAATPEYAFKTAEWYWSSRNGNAVADGGDINDITLMVNGGYHGLAERTEYYNRGLQVLGR